MTLKAGDKVQVSKVMAEKWEMSEESFIIGKIGRCEFMGEGCERAGCPGTITPSDGVPRFSDCYGRSGGGYRLELVLEKVSTNIWKGKKR